MYIEALIKITGAILVIISVCTFAKETNNLMNQRIAQLMKLYSILSQLESELKYLNRTLPECFQVFLDNAEYPFNIWFDNMANEMNNERTNDFSAIWSKGLKLLYDNSALSQSDIEILSGLKDKLGSYDVDAGVKAIDYVLLQLEEKRLKLLSKAGENKKVMLSLCMFVGLMIVIFLL